MSNDDELRSLDVISRYEKECNKNLTKTDYIKEDNVLYYDDEIPVFNQKELNNLAKGNIIKGDIKVLGFSDIKFIDIREIKGSLKVLDSSLQGFGSLEKIGGSLEIIERNTKSTIESLDNILHINGNVFLDTETLNLNKLKYIGGDLDLTCHNSVILGDLEVIKGDLLIPFHMIEDLDLSRLNIEGKIRHRKYKRMTKSLNSYFLGNLTESNIDIPFINKSYDYSLEQKIERMNKYQFDFYKYFREQFFKDIFIDIGINYSYVFGLYFDIINDIERKGDSRIGDLSLKSLNNLERNYPFISFFTNKYKSDLIDKNDDYESLWKLKEVNLHFSNLIPFQYKLG